MAVFKQRTSKNWYVKIYVKGSGRAKRKYIRVSTGTDDKAKALAIEQALIAANNRTMESDRLHKIIDVLTGNECAKKNKLPVSMIFDEHIRWMNTVNKSLSAETLSHRSAACKKFIAWVEAKYPAAAYAEDVDRQCVIAFSEFLVKQKFKSKTRRNNIGDLGVVWSSLMRARDGFPSNPWALVLPQIASDSERGKPFTKDEEIKVLKAAGRCGLGWHLACLISRYTGLRYGDIASLRWKDVDFNAGIIRITPKKTQRHSVHLNIPISGTLSRAFVNQIRGMDLKPSQDDFVIPEHGKVYPNNQPSIPFSQILKTAGLPTGKYTFHSWRHTFRTRLAEAGVSDEIAKRLGGWKNDGMALHYDHDGRIAELREAIEKI